MITFSLQSGSNGNAIYVEADGARLLFDAGISGKQARMRMAAHGRDIRAVTALLITHDHADHVCCAGIYQRLFNIPIYMTEPTYRAVRNNLGQVHDVRYFRAGDTLEFGPVRVHSRRTPHDAADGLTYIVETGRVPHSPTGGSCGGSTGGSFDGATGGIFGNAAGDVHGGVSDGVSGGARGGSSDGSSSIKRLGVFTDLGHPTDALIEQLESVDAAYLESNYDPVMLEEGPYPPDLKDRIRGAGGHLSNEESAQLIQYCNGRHRWIALAHLSEHNNHPTVALRTHRGLLGDDRVLHVAGRRDVSEIFHL
jgi:phosphoribosyl 1,2-cyclic phosphodiesterase